MIHITPITPNAEVIAAVFPSLEDFKDWADDLMIHDLHYWLKEFEKYELYEHCCVLRDLIIDYDESMSVIELVYNKIKYNGLDGKV